MLNAIYVPRLNANEDELTLVKMAVCIDQKVNVGDALFDVESAKAGIEVVSEYEGYVLALNAEVGDIVDVGSIVLWIGDSIEERNAILPKDASLIQKRKGFMEPTLKALQLIKEHSIDADAIPYNGDRITATDVDAYLASRALQALTASSASRGSTISAGLVVKNKRVPLTSYQKAMTKTVSWQYQNACATYLEIIFNHSLWREYADIYAKQHRLMLDPMLSLMTYALIKEALKKPLINSTIEGEDLVTYNSVNMGFTVEANDHLFLVVVEDAEAYGQLEFVKKLGALQKKAFKGDLQSNEMSGATIAFTSLAKRGVSRHIPILPPGAALMVSHAAPLRMSGENELELYVPCVLGATYDHRVLDGSAVAQVLTKISMPSNEA